MPARSSRLALASLLTVALFFLFEYVARISPSLASTAMIADLGLSRAEFGLFSSLFFWVYAPMQIVVGLALDRWGARRFVLPAILSCAGGMMIVGAAPSALWADLGRLLTGFGASFAFVSALYVVNHWFAPQRFALLSGAVNAIGMLGTAMGAIWLTALIEAMGWRAVFTGTGIAGLAVLALAVMGFRDAPGAGDRVTHRSVLGPLAVILRDAQVWRVAIVGALSYMPVTVYGALWGNGELMADHALSAVRAETAVSMVFWGTAAGSVLWGAVSDRLGHRKWILAGGTLAAALAWSGVLFTAIGSVWAISALLFVAGLAGGVQMLSFAMAKEGQDRARAGTVTAFVNAIAIAAALIFQPLVGAILDATGGDYAAALAAVPICLALGALLTLTLREPDTPHFRAHRAARAHRRAQRHARHHAQRKG